MAAVDNEIQQSTRNWRPRWEGCWRGGAWGLERVGGRYSIFLGNNSNITINNLFGGLRQPLINHFTHNNQPKKNRSGAGRCKDVARLLGSVGGYKSIVLEKIEWRVLNK